MITTRYVVGFLFSPDQKQVCLILKNRPDWMAGFYNGVGGKIEKEDYGASHSMAREFEEEAGVWIHPTEWREFCTLTHIRNTNQMGIVHFFVTKSEDIKKVNTIGDESVEVLEVAKLHEYNLMQNLRYLIPMSLDLAIKECRLYINDAP